MQDKYVGDAGDFGNNGLLRWLSGMTCPCPTKKVRLGVTWYLFEDGESAGKLTNYKRNRNCDKELYNRLAKILEWSKADRNHRTVQAIQRWGILPGDTAYFEDELSFRDTPSVLPRTIKRKEWLRRAIQAMKPAELVFINPDNGISDKSNGIAKSVSKFGKKGPKYTYMDDCSVFFEMGKSLVIYHHLRSKGKAKPHIRKVSRILCRELKNAEVWAFQYHRGTSRAYFIVVHPNQKETLGTRLEYFKRDNNWCKRRNSPFTFILGPDNSSIAKCKP